VDCSAEPLPGAWGGYSVRRSGRLAEVAMDSPSCRLSLEWCWAQLPGDGFEETEADEKADGGSEEDSPGVGREAEGGTGAWGRHDGVSLEEGAAPMKNYVGATGAQILREGGMRRRD
jgi:hypothetical protein